MNEQKTQTAVKTSDVAVVLPSIEVNRNQLIGVLIKQKGHTFIGMSATVDVKMNKGGRENSNYLYGNVVKDSEIGGSVDFEYENSVNNALAKHGEKPDFIVGDRKWGHHMIIDQVFDIETLSFVPVYSRIIIEHEKDGEKRYYIQMSVRNSQPPVYRYKDSGEVLSETDLAVMKSYMPTRKDEIVVLRDYRIDNVKKLRINKTEYVLKQ
jgi:hypothetical protein